MSNDKIVNLDEGVQEGFKFILDGNEYFMKYPTTEELEEIQKIKEPLEQTDKMFELAHPVDSSKPSLKEALKKKNVKVLQRFQEMLLSELGTE